MSATLQHTVSIDLSVNDIADAFVAMTSGEQAKFFDRVANSAVEAWGEYKAGQQWSSVALAMTEHGSEEGVRLIEHLMESVRHFLAHPPQKVEWQTIMDPRTQRGDFRR